MSVLYDRNSVSGVMHLNDCEKNETLAMRVTRVYKLVTFKISLSSQMKIWSICKY